MPPRNPSGKPEKPQKAQSLYSQGDSGYSDFDEVKTGPPQVPAFVKTTQSYAKMFASYGKNGKFTDEEADAFAFLGWDVTPEQFCAAYKGIRTVGLMIGVVMAVAFFFLAENFLTDLLMRGVFCAIFIAMPLLISQNYRKTPFQQVEKEKIQSLAYVPEIINYLTMSMRLTPNLERAVEFAASHGRGKIAEDLKKIVWDVQLGRYESVEEGLDELAYRWGAYNDDFKHALMMIRASVLEADKERRFALLDKAGQDVLEGSKEKMDHYARKLQQPTVYLYYFGILLPLLMAILLPIGSSLANIDLLSRGEFLFVVYNIMIPIGVFVFGKNILSNKPPTGTPPKIPANFPGLPKTKPFTFVAIALILGGVTLGYLTDIGTTADVINGAIYLPAMHAFIDPTNDNPDPLLIPGTLGGINTFLVRPEERQEKILDQLAVLTKPEEAGVPRNSQIAEELQKIPYIRLFAQLGIFVGEFAIFGFLLGTGIAISIYLNGKYSERKKVQDDVRAMETEFKDAMYVLASRMGENKPIEEALRSAVAFLPKSKIGRDVFRRIIENISTLGMTLETAIFDKTFGALRLVPSQIIRSGMQFLVDSVDLGVDVAARSLIALSMQLRNSEKINESLRKLLQDVTVMLSTMASFVAPIVLGVVSAMQRLIISSLASQGSTGVEAGVDAGTGGSAVGGLGGGGLSSMFQGKGLENAAEPGLFILVLGIYALQIVILLTYFNSQIEDTGNELHTYTAIAKNVPLAIGLYCATVYLAGTFFS
ncbi:hypothetical protein HY994_03580 [Candidatus Micrarchaeota archaeon]|nr:hypothetical protein [Candidatus Micrarchaeota archaeon]